MDKTKKIMAPFIKIMPQLEELRDKWIKSFKGIENLAMDGWYVSFQIVDGLGQKLIHEIISGWSESNNKERFSNAIKTYYYSVKTVSYLKNYRMDINIGPQSFKQFLTYTTQVTI